MATLYPQPSDGFQSLQIHTQQLHSNIFLELPDTVLNSIGWTRCCERCPNLFLGTTDLTSHQQICPIFQQTHIPDPDFSTNPTWAIAFTICPTTRTDELNKLINNSPDENTPEMTLPTILTTVSQWCPDALPSASAHATTTTTSHTTND